MTSFFVRRPTAGLFVVLFAELIPLTAYGLLLPRTIPETAARAMLQSLVELDGVLIGFAGLVFAVIAERRPRRRGLADLLSLLMMVIVFLFVSIAVGFAALAAAVEGLARSEFVNSLLFTAWGITTLFYGVASEYFPANDRGEATKTQVPSSRETASASGGPAESNRCLSQPQRSPEVALPTHSDGL